MTDDLTSLPSLNVTQFKNSGAAVNTRSDVHESEHELKCTKQTKSNYFYPEHEDEGDTVLEITDTSPESSHRNDKLHDTNKNMETVETDSDSEVIFVSQMLLMTDSQQEQIMLDWVKERGKKAEKENPVKDTTDTCEPVDVKSPIACEEADDMPKEITHVCNAETAGPVWSVPTGFESDSDEDLASLQKSYKRQQTFSKFECDQKSDKCSPSVFNESLQSPTKQKIDCRDLNLSESTQNADSGSGVESKAVDCSPLGRLRERKISGNTKRVAKEVDPFMEHSSPLAAANPAQNSKGQTSVKTYRKKAGDSKLGNEQSAIQNVQPRRSSARKVRIVNYAEQDESDYEACDVVTKRVSPRKKAKRKIEGKEVVQNCFDKLTENQAKLLALHVASGQKCIAGDNQNKAEKQASPKNSKTGKRGKNIKGSVSAKEKKGLTDASTNQITVSLGTGKKTGVGLDEGWMSTRAERKAISLEVERIESLTKGMLDSDDNDSSDNNGSTFLADKCRKAKSQERDEENARYISIMENLSLPKITNWFKKHKREVHGIFYGQTPSLQQKLCNASKEEQDPPDWVTSMTPFSDDQLSHILNLLIKEFCQKDPLSHFKFMWKVLVPELAQRIFMDEFDLGNKESLEKIQGIYFTVNDDSD